MGVMAEFYFALTEAIERLNALERRHYESAGKGSSFIVPSEDSD